MYFLIKWLIGRLKRRAAVASREPGTVEGPDQPMVRSPGDRLVSPDRTVAPGAGRDGAALSVRNLSKRFGNRIAFQDVSFEVGHGEVFGFLGPNGAGKTTTVRTLPAVDGWRQDGAAGYVLHISDPAVAAPAATRALVAAGADVLSIGQSRHSLEDVYLELISQDEEARRR
jgi:ABC-type glutathione transport system ATPase component